MNYIVTEAMVKDIAERFNLGNDAQDWEIGECIDHIIDYYLRFVEKEHEDD